MEIQTEPEYLEILSTMDLKKLDLFVHIPTEASEYSDELVQNMMGSIAPPPLNKKSSIKAATDIALHVSNRQADELNWLTLHISRPGLIDRAQPYMMFSGLQLRRNEREDGVTNSKYSVHGSMDWTFDSSIEEEIMFNEKQGCCSHTDSCDLVTAVRDSQFVERSVPRVCPCYGSWNKSR